MSEYINPDSPVPGMTKFLKPQMNEMPDPGFYYMGGGMNPFNQPMFPTMNQMPQQGMMDSRRFLPDPQPQQVAPQAPQQMGLNAFVESRRMNPMPQQSIQPSIPQPPQVSPWAQMVDQPMYPMNNNNMFMQPYMDPLSVRPYGNYSDMEHGQLVPPINRRTAWSESNVPTMVYQSPYINWDALNQTPQNQTMYSPNCQMSYSQNGSPFGAPSVFQDNTCSSSWDERSKKIWSK